ncbi:MAG: Sec-independent protein translocase protein TatB [Candidatus Nanopelagicales bacterium]
MFDIGIGELLALAVIGLLVFGPEKLPKAAADAAKWARQIRQMASSARQEIVDSAGIDLGETMDGLKDLRDLHPRRLASGIFEDEPTPTNESATRPVSQQPGSQPGSPPVQAFDPDVS